jgi:hypothetical protein
MDGDVGRPGVERTSYVEGRCPATGGLGLVLGHDPPHSDCWQAEITGDGTGLEQKLSADPRGEGSAQARSGRGG